MLLEAKCEVSMIEVN